MINIIAVTVIGVLFDDITKYFTIIGGYLEVVICFYAPLALYLKASTRPLSHWKNIIVLIVMHLLVLYGWIVATMSFFIPRRQ